MIRRYLIAIITILIYNIPILAQESAPSLSEKPVDPDNFWRRVSVGGNIGFQVGSVTGISVAPEVAIRTVDQLHVGIRAIYQYFSAKNYFYDTRTGDYLTYKSNVLGGGIYLRYYLSSLFDNFLGNLFAHTEYEYLVYNRPYIPRDYSSGGYILGADNLYYIPGKDIIEYNSIFVGGGFRQPLGNRVSMDLMVLFNLNDSYNSPYTNPIFRFGVGVGL